MRLTLCDWHRSGYGFTWNDAQRINRFADMIAHTAELLGVPDEWSLALGITWVESRFFPTARSSAGAMGLMQLMPATWEAMRDDLRLAPDADPWHPSTNVAAGVNLIRHLRRRWGADLDSQIASYFAGSGNVQRHGWRRYASYVKAVRDAQGRFVDATLWCRGQGPRGPEPDAPEPARPSSPRTPTRPPPSSPTVATAGGGGALALLLVLALWAWGR